MGVTDLVFARESFEKVCFGAKLTQGPMGKPVFWSYLMLMQKIESVKFS